MKQLELTLEHKNKLLEMCKLLFPEYQFSMFNNGLEYEIDEFLININNVNVNITMHWFEFVVLKLLEKVAMYKNLTIKQFEPILINIYKEETHPVDILYYELNFNNVNETT